MLETELLRDHLSTIKELERTLENRWPTCLDELVHDRAGSIATEHNNGGIPAQLDFLLRSGMSPQEILKAATNQ